MESIPGEKLERCPSALTGVWRRHLVVFSVACLLLFLLYWDVVQSLVNIWWSDETYGHGFLILPISLYLVYQNRAKLAAIAPSFQWNGVGLTILCSVVWIASAVLHIELFQQVLLVGFLTAIIWALLGWKVLLQLLFPLAFLFFAIPLWGFIITAPLQEITARVATFALTLFGVPVLAEGHFITIPSGVFQVAKTCAGTRYFIAGLTLSVLFVHIAYNSYLKKALFLLIAIAVIIAANCVRVIAVIMAGHLTDMQHPWVEDHISMGWWLFMAFMVPLFWIGIRYMDPQIDEVDSQSGECTRIPQDTNRRAFWRKGGVISVSVLALLMLGPASVATLGMSQENMPHLSPPTTGSSGWRGPLEKVGIWKPIFVGADQEVMASYEKSGAVVHYYSAHYFQQAQGRELASVVNRLYDKSSWQQLPGRGAVILDLGELWPHQVQQTTIRSTRGADELVVWQWYSVAGRVTASGNRAKVFELLKFVSHRNESVAVALAVNGSDSEEALNILKSFLQDMGESIDEGVKLSH